MSHIVLRGGTVVNADNERRGDIEIRDGKVVALHEPGVGADVAVDVDVDGLLVLPGMVDTHVHFMEPGDPSREDFATGSVAAACAGVTTVLEHTHGWPVTTPDRLREKRAVLEGRSHVDYGLVAHVWPDHLDELPQLWADGIVYFKAFTCATHGVPAVHGPLLDEVAEELARLGAPCLVHCEDDAMTAQNEAALKAAGRHDGGVIPEWRSLDAELAATLEVSAIALRHNAGLIVAHASNAQVLTLLADERTTGSPILAESCPQYFHLWENEVEQKGAFRKFTPPARIRCEQDQRRMWGALNAGLVNHLSSDHAPSTSEQKRAGDIWEVHFGLPGVDTTLPLMLDAALRGLTTMSRVVRSYADAPARLYGLTGKGRLEPGFDADIVLVDPDSSWTVRDEDIQSRAGWSPYSGRSLRGGVVATYLRGLRIAESRAPLGEASGRWLAGPGYVAGD